jgi:putative heme-binding domain-containing protein
MNFGKRLSIGLGLFAVITIHAAESTTDPGGQLRDFGNFAMTHNGDPIRGRALFNDNQRPGCVKCHSIDGSSSKAAPDLQAAGDKFPRRELIRAVLEPSRDIAIGYGTTIIVTRSGDEHQGIVKQVTAAYVELMNADGKPVRIPTGEIREQRGSPVSLMPEGLPAGLTREEFADLIEYLTTLRQPENLLSSNRGMPPDIPELARPVAVRPFLGADMQFPHAFVERPGDVRYGLVGMLPFPGTTNWFVAVHQTGTIWLLEKKAGGDEKTVFADIGADIFRERGPNGLLGMAFHPGFLENRKYYLKHQVFEDGKIATVVVERLATPDLHQDSGRPSRRLWKVESTTQDHSGGWIAFGPDGFLYIGMGDTGPQQDPQGHGQNRMLHLGKMLRIDVDHRDAGLEYAIPADNPFRGRAEVRPEIWAYGFREPWRFSFDRLTGDLWVGDVGQDRVEEVTIVRRGENHGWNVFEGFEPFSNQYRRDGEQYVPPVFAYRRKFGNSITGGYVYRGDRQSSFYGVYICGDYTSHRIFGLRQQDRQLQVVREIATSPQNIASFAEDASGNLYVVGYEGMIYQLDFTGTHFDGATLPGSSSTPGRGSRESKTGATK